MGAAADRPAYGAAWADFDRDGDLDLAVSFVSGAFAIFRNDGDAFAEVAVTPDVPAPGPQARSLAWGDVDADGYPDLFVATRGGNVLLRNLAGEGFAEEAAERGLAGGKANPRQSTFVDFDGDGDIDLFQAERSGANRFYVNDGGRFVEKADRYGLADERSSVGACWLDIDRDGDLDVFVANQGGQAAALFRNDGDRFVDVAEQAGVAGGGEDPKEGSVGCALADFDHDGLLDLYVASYGYGPLFRNRGDGTFVDVANDVGVAVEGHYVSAAWGDLDRDGWDDLYVVGYTGSGDDARPAGRLFMNRAGKFVEDAAAAEILNHGDHGLVFADFDGDGALDAAITQSYSAQSRFWLLRNRSPVEPGRSVLAVEPRGPDGALPVAGAEVRLLSASGDLVATRHADTGGGYGSQGMAPLQFAVDAGEPYRLEVRYPGAGEARTVSVEPVAAGEGSVTTIVIPAPTEIVGPPCQG